ncbi:MAG: heparan-alpha-glucosaminide N-acetyltransferase domain-containing protein [Candidatus Hermodarchaeota archaeon]
MTQQEVNFTKTQERILSIDIFKGLAVLLMVFVNSIQIYENIPAWTKHAGDYGLTYVDLVAPFFVFMLALNLNISYNRRVEILGKKRSLVKYLRRYLTFIGIGLALTIYVDVNEFYLRWGTLQVLGASGLMVLPLLHLKPYIKLIFAVFFMTLHQYLLFTPLSTVIYNALEGGIFGIFSWGSMMILSSFLAEGLNNEKKYIMYYFFFGGLICLITGFNLAFIFSLSRPYISLPYILVSVGIASIVYYILYCLYDKWIKRYQCSIKLRILSPVGRNAFISYITHILFAWLIFSVFPITTPGIIIFSVAILHTTFIWILTYFMNKQEAYFVI